MRNHLALLSLTALFGAALAQRAVALDTPALNNLTNPAQKLDLQKPGSRPGAPPPAKTPALNQVNVKGVVPLNNPNENRVSNPKAGTNTANSFTGCPPGQHVVPGTGWVKVAHCVPDASLPSKNQPKQLNINATAPNSNKSLTFNPLTKNAAKLVSNGCPKGYHPMKLGALGTKCMHN